MQNGKSQKLLSPQLDNSGENWMKKFLIVQLIWWHWFELGILVSKKHYFEQAFRVRHLLQSPPKSGLVFSKADQNKEEKDAGIGMDGLIPQVDMLDSKSLHGGWPCFGIFHAASQLRPPSLSKAKVAAKLPIFSTHAGGQKKFGWSNNLACFHIMEDKPNPKMKIPNFYLWNEILRRCIPVTFKLFFLHTYMLLYTEDFIMWRQKPNKECDCC